MGEGSGVPILAALNPTALLANANSILGIDSSNKQFKASQKMMDDQNKKQLALEAEAKNKAEEDKRQNDLATKRGQDKAIQKSKQLASSGSAGTILTSPLGYVGAQNNPQGLKTLLGA